MRPGAGGRAARGAELTREAGAERGAKGRGRGVSDKRANWARAGAGRWAHCMAARTARTPSRVMIRSFVSILADRLRSAVHPAACAGSARNGTAVRASWCDRAGGGGFAGGRAAAAPALPDSAIGQPWLPPPGGCRPPPPASASCLRCWPATATRLRAARLPVGRDVFRWLTAHAYGVHGHNTATRVRRSRLHARGDCCRGLLSICRNLRRGETLR